MRCSVSSADCDADVSIFPVEARTSQLGLLSIPRALTLGKSHFLLGLPPFTPGAPRPVHVNVLRPGAPPPALRLIHSSSPPPAGSCAHSQLIHTILVLAH
eukprot:scaffold8226_cov114-Isochrysis_galbana.AAC.1